MLVRDAFRCRDCGVPTTEVHHVASRSAFGKNRLKDCWQPKNMITLCRACHEKAGHPVNRRGHLKMLCELYGYDYGEMPWAKILGGQP